MTDSHIRRIVTAGELAGRRSSSKKGFTGEKQFLRSKFQRCKLRTSSMSGVLHSFARARIWCMFELLNPPRKDMSQSADWTGFCWRQYQYKLAWSGELHERVEIEIPTSTEQIWLSGFVSEPDAERTHAQCASLHMIGSISIGMRITELAPSAPGLELFKVEDPEIFMIMRTCDRLQSLKRAVWLSGFSQPMLMVRVVIRREKASRLLQISYSSRFWRRLVMFKQLEVAPGELLRNYQIASRCECRDFVTDTSSERTSTSR